MKKQDYKNLTKITVKSQKELDMIPLDFKGRIYIEFGTYFKPAIVNNRYELSVVAWENSSVVAMGNSSVEARENSSVVAWENSSVVARENSSVVAMGNSSVVAWENSSVEAMGSSSVEARENSSVVAWENSSVVARENSSVVARENSSVVARENSSVEAWGNVQVLDCLVGGKIEISGNARIVYNPKAIREFMNFYDIKHDKKKAVFYKAVHKKDNRYFSDYNNSFLYNIGQEIKIKCDTNVNEDCSYGIHISHLNWALNYGKDWHDLAILEVETDIDKIVLPKNSDGKVRTSEITVLREVPLGECGLYGEILAKKRSEKR